MFPKAPSSVRGQRPAQRTSRYWDDVGNRRLFGPLAISFLGTIQSPSHDRTVHVCLTLVQGREPWGRAKRSMSMRQFITVAALSAYAIAACGGSAVGRTSARTSSTKSHTSTIERSPQAVKEVLTATLSTPVTYPGAGAQIDPPGTLLPSLSAATVLGFCSIPRSDVACETGQPRSVVLGLLTDTGMGIQGELVWAMTWTDVNCDLMGPQGRPTPPPTVNDVTGCDFVTFVNAATGGNPEAIRGAFGL
jgi:hypothetical protein